MTLSYINAATWAVGNGLVSTTLVVYLALARGANGLAISLIVSAPHFAGLLRLAVPALMAWYSRRKPLCIIAYVTSAVVLCAVPIATLPRFSLGNVEAISVLVVAWCLYHLLEYAGTIALWSWLGDLAPRRIRGRFCGYRERWLVAGRIGGIVFTVALAWLWGRVLPEGDRWQPLAASAAIGAALLAVSVVPLALIPAMEYMPSAVPRTPWRAVLRATFKRPYRQLVLFSCYSSLVHGVTASAQSAFPWRILGMPYWSMQLLQGLMRAGQTAIAPTMGRCCDLWGSRPVMIVSLLVSGIGPLFFVAATPDRWWWLVGAYIAWTAYAGLNVGFDNAKLKLAPPDNTAPYLAVYYALADFVFAVMTVAAGLCIDGLVGAGWDQTQVYAGVFIVGFFGRLLGVPILIGMEEPGALRLRDLPARIWRRSPAA